MESFQATVLLYHENAASWLNPFYEKERGSEASVETSEQSPTLSDRHYAILDCADCLLVLQRDSTQ
jgi:hypothetical protein